MIDGQYHSTCQPHHTQSRPPQARPERWWWTPPTRSPPSPPSPTRQWPPGSWRGGWGGWWVRWRRGWGCARRRTPREVTMAREMRMREGGWWLCCISICICICLMVCDSRLVAVLSFMRRVLTRVVRPPTLLKAAMQALALADIKIGEGEVVQSNIDFYCNVKILLFHILKLSQCLILLPKVPTSVQQRLNSWPTERQVK